MGARDDREGAIASMGAQLNNLEAEVDVVKSRVSSLESLHIYNEFFSGTLSSSDNLSNQRLNRYADYYTFTTASNAWVEISLGSTTLASNGQYGDQNFFDTYLFLHNEADYNNYNSSNDDAGAGYNSFIRRYLTAGTYTVQVTSYRANAIGDYQVKIEQQETPTGGGTDPDAGQF